MLTAKELVILDENKKNQIISNLEQTLHKIAQWYRLFKLDSGQLRALNNFQLQIGDILQPNSSSRDRRLQYVSMFIGSTNIEVDDDWLLIKQPSMSKWHSNLVEMAYPKIQKEILLFEFPTSIWEAIDLLFKNPNKFDAQFLFFNYIIDHVNRWMVSSELQEVLDSIDSRAIESEEQMKVFVLIKKWLTLCQWLIEWKRDIDGLWDMWSFYTIASNHYIWFNQDDLLGIFELQKWLILWIRTIDAIKAALSREQRNPANILLSLDNQILSQHHFKSDIELSSYNIFINKLIKYM